MTDTHCTTCSVFRPDADPRIPHRPPVCDGDRTLMDRHLGDIARLDEELRNDEGPIVDDRQYERFGRDGAPLGTAWADPLARFGGVAPINSRSSQPAVTGSRERPIPIRVDLHDLQAPARVGNPTRDPANGKPLHQHLVPQLKVSTETETVASQWDNKLIVQTIRKREYVRDDRGQLVLVPAQDPDGRQSAATVLDQWVRDVRETLFPDHHLPPATVLELATWLRNRLEDICDRHPAVDEFAAEMRDLRGALRSAAGETDPPPERCEGVACKQCNMQMLFRQPDSDVHCANVNCNAVYREEEYQDWVKTLAAEQKVKRHAQPENAEALQG